MTPVAGDLTGYLSRTHARWLAEEAARRWRSVEGSLLFADISGFTPLSERLATLGRHGGERVLEIVGGVLSDLVDVVDEHGGDTLKFGGDALLVMFEGEAHERRAAACAWAMQRTMRPHRRTRTEVGTIELRVSIGIGSGDIVLVVAGSDPRELLVVGPTATATVTHESAANAGEVLVGPSTAAALDPSCLGEERAGARLLARRPAAPPAPEAPALAPSEDVLLAGLPAFARAGVPAEGEHRMACIAFAQIRGCDDLLASEGHAALADALDHHMTAIQRACGRNDVALLATDVDNNAVKTLMTTGAPTAGLDNEDRMLHALREIVDAGGPLAVRAGANRGRVFASDLGAPHRRVYTTMGDDTNLAARLMGKAGAGEVCAAVTLLENARDVFERTPLEPFRVKGKSHPIAAALVGGSGEARHARAGEGPVVGREREIAALRRLLSDAAEGRGAAVELVGEPGIGKSRLVASLIDSAEARPVVLVQGGAYARLAPYRALRRPLRELLPGAPTGPEAVEPALTAFVRGEVPELEPWLPLIALPFGVDLPETPEVAALRPENRRARLHSALDELLQRLLPEAGTLVVVEDAHWLDDPSADLLAALARRRTAGGWLVVSARAPAEGGLWLPEDVTERWSIEPLSKAAAAELLERAAGRKFSPATVALLLERAQGNPLFLKELAAASAGGADADELPETVEALVAARIDTLEVADRGLLRRAAVLGGRFVRPLLDAVAEGGREAVDEALARLDPFLQPDDELDLRFRHGIIREAAYAGLAFRERRRVHGLAAEHLERAARGRPEPVAELLAVHFHAAGRPDGAWRYSRLAGELAQRRAAPAEAVAHYERALDAARLLPDADESERAAVAERLGDAGRLAGLYPQAAGGYRTARRALSENPLAIARLCRKEGWLRERYAPYSQALRWYARGLAALEGAGNGETELERARLVLARGAARLRQGRYRESIRLLKEAAAKLERLDDRASLAHACYLLDWACTDHGLPEEASRYRAVALPVYEELGDHVGTGNVLNNLAINAYYEGRVVEAVDLYERARDAFERGGDILQVAAVENNIGELLSDDGESGAAEELFRRALATWREAAYPVGIALATSNLGRAATRRGDHEGARELLAEAAAAFRALGAGQLLLEAEAREAERRLAAGELEDALELAKALIPRAAEVDIVLAMLERVAGCALAWLGRPGEAEQHLQNALARARAAGHGLEESLSADALTALRASGQAPRSWSRPGSSITGRPSSSALVNFDPGSEPATT